MIRALVLTLLFALASLPPANAFSTDDVLGGAILPGWKTEAGRMVALRLDLAPGWKTYWRDPGNVGIPPRFDWSESSNLRSVHLFWPSPKVFESSGLKSIGYHDRLVLPIELEAKDPNKPIDLSVRIELGVCDNICVPAKLRLTALVGGPDAPSPEIHAALGAQPASGKAAGFRPPVCVLAPSKDGLRLTARLSMPEETAQAVAIETTDPSLQFRAPRLDHQGSATSVETEAIFTGPGAIALDRSKLMITVIGRDRALEFLGCPAP